ncbi:hypothetical protein acdb102_21830 [Acidothermaceae bacterium B102]|nr:hypothetical protein acdb102_21830 [Acidothermaceae bacterium B102]
MCGGPVTVIVCGVPVPGGPPAGPLPMSSFTVCQPAELATGVVLVEAGTPADVAAAEAPVLPDVAPAADEPTLAEVAAADTELEPAEVPPAADELLLDVPQAARTTMANGAATIAGLRRKRRGSILMWIRSLSDFESLRPEVGAGSARLTFPARAWSLLGESSREHEVGAHTRAARYKFLD